MRKASKMKKGKDYWGPVFDSFIEEYPKLAEDIVDWYPSGQMEIALKTGGGKRYIYDFMSRSIYLIFDETEGIELSEEDFNQRFSERLYYKLMRVGMTQYELSRKTGISSIMISRYCTGKSIPTVYNLLKIMKALRCSINELIYG